VNTKFAICNEIFRDWKLEDVIHYVATTGYDAVEIAPFTLAKYVTDVSSARRQQISDLAKRADIAVCGIHWVLVNTDGMHLTHSDSAVRRRTAKYLSDLVDFCADVGGKIVVFGSPKQRSLLPGVSAMKAWEFAVETFRDSVKRAEDRSVTLCLEPLSPSETDFINTAEEAIRFVDQFHSSQFQIILDAKAMCSEAKPIPEIIRASAMRFAHFHANDKNLKGPGFSDVDYKPIAAALKEVGYTGYVSVEVFKFDEGAEVIATKSIEYLKHVFDNASG